MFRVHGHPADPDRVDQDGQRTDLTKWTRVLESQDLQRLDTTSACTAPATQAGDTASLARDTTNLARDTTSLAGDTTSTLSLSLSLC